MPRNPWDISFGPKPPKGKGYNPFAPPKQPKRTLGERDKKILYRLAKGKCEACNKKIQYDEMQGGHKKAASRGGKATLKNSVCLCWRCNNLQGNDSWEKFCKKMRITNTKTATDRTHEKGGKNKTTRRKPKSKGNYWVNPLTGRKEKVQPLFSM